MKTLTSGSFQNKKPDIAISSVKIKKLRYNLLLHFCPSQTFMQVVAFLKWFCYYRFDNSIQDTLLFTFFDEDCFVGNSYTNITAENI